MYWLGAAAIVVLWLWVLQRPADIGPDLEVYSRTVSEMRQGHGYYQAMYDALSAVKDHRAKLARIDSRPCSISGGSRG